MYYVFSTKLSFIVDQWNRWWCQSAWRKFRPDLLKTGWQLCALLPNEGLLLLIWLALQRHYLKYGSCLLKLSNIVHTLASKQRIFLNKLFIFIWEILLFLCKVKVRKHLPKPLNIIVIYIIIWFNSCNLLSSIVARQ